MIKVILMGLMVIGCGVQELNAPPETDLMNYLGGKAKDTRQYFSQRNISSEDFQNFTNTIADQTDRGYVDNRDNTQDYFADRNVSAGHLSEGVKTTDEDVSQYFTDRNVTGEDLQNFENKVASDVEMGALDTKSYSKSKYEAIVLGDVDERTAINEDRRRLSDLEDRASESEGRLSSAESRLVAEEAKSFAQAVLIDQMALAAELRFLLIEGRVGVNESEISDLKLSLDAKVKKLESDLEIAIANLTDYVDVENAAQDVAAALLRSYVDSENDSQDTTTEQNKLDLETSISNLESYVDSENDSQNYQAMQILRMAKRYVDRRDRNLSRQLSYLRSYMSREHRNIRNLISSARQYAYNRDIAQDISLVATLASLRSDLEQYADDNDDDTVFDPSSLIAQIIAAEASAKQYADDNDDDTVFDPSSLEDRLSEIEVDVIPELTGLIGINTAAIGVLENEPDLTCSTVNSTLKVYQRYKYYHGGNNHYHWVNQWRDITIPTVTCPTQQP